MADIVFGLGSSHGPLLALPPDMWSLRAEDDKKNPALEYRGEKYKWDDLRDLRVSENIAAQVELPVREERHAACQEHIAELGRRLADVNPDVLVIVGDDQHEWFQPENMPTFAVYYGDHVLNRPPAKDIEKKSKALALAAMNYRTPNDVRYETVPDLALKIISQAKDDGFDIATCGGIPQGEQGNIGIGHAFGYVQRRICNDKPIPFVPVMLNTFYPPNQATPKRCFKFGQMLGRAIRNWDSNKKVAIVASGGLSHFVIDEEHDQRMIAAFKANDPSGLTGEPDELFRSGTSETKNWITSAGVLSESGLAVDMFEYVPCYRSEAGTGNAMGFATWT
ncbi:MAG: hypothetical protein VW169_14640 [Rhodospirillaceae bacterium]